VDASEQHCLLIAPTGAGKSRCFLIPNLLCSRNPIIAVDSKGELSLTTADFRRRTMGHRVVNLDPFKIASDGSDSFNPLDAVAGDPEQIDDNSKAMASSMASGQRGTKEPFWDDNAIDAVAGGIAHVARDPDPEKRNLGRVWDIFSADDAVYQIAVLLDVSKHMSRFAHDNLKMFLDHEDRVRSSVLSTIRQHLRILSSSTVRQSLSSTSFSIDEVRDGRPLTVYLILPVQKLLSHAGLMRLWLSSLMNIIGSRTVIPEQPTIFIADELASLGAVPEIFSAVTLMRGFGMRCVLVYQSLDQIKTQWPAGHRTVIDNCGVLATFGRIRAGQAMELAAIMGDVVGEDIVTLPADQLYVARSGAASERLRKFDYLKDPAFRGRFRANPYYAKQPLADK
jgi:type IV secretion system protein VirD4